jgi:hypothetical protein
VPATTDPELALRLAAQVADVYSNAVTQLFRLVTKRLAQGIDQPGWAEQKLAELVRVRADATVVLERLAVLGPEAAEAAIRQAWALGQRAALSEATITASLTPATSTAAVEALVAETVTQTFYTHGQILREFIDVYRDVITQTSVVDVTTGTMTRRQAAQRALDRFATRGITGFTDRSGRRWQLESYVEMATRTGAGHAHVAGSLDTYVANGRDLVIVSDAPQECRLCRPWEGKVLSITGNTPGYRTVAAARSAGLHHPNCRHRLSVYVPGLTRPMSHTADPEGDQARQEQRRLERGIRAWKRRQAAALDGPASQAAAGKVIEWQQRLREHIAEHDLKRLPYRERIGRAR